MKARFIAMVACLLLCQATHAEVYKCTVDGEIAYSQQPCSSDAASVQRVPNITMGVNDKSLYIAEALKAAEFSMLGLRASMRDSQGCVGERERQCYKFIDLIDSRKLTEIYAILLSEKFNAEDVDNIYEYCKYGPGRKDIELAFVELTMKLFPDERIKAAQPLTEADIANRAAFFKSATGMRFLAFLKDSANEYKKAYTPYLSALAKQAGLTK